jgi:hypothetical protein
MSIQNLKKKVYNVLVESLQNLFHHVDTVPEGLTMVQKDWPFVILKKNLVTG